MEMDEIVYFLETNVNCRRRFVIFLHLREQNVSVFYLIINYKMYHLPGRQHV